MKEVNEERKGKEKKEMGKEEEKSKDPTSGSKR